MPTILKQNTFDGEVSTVDLNVHDSGYEYQGASDRYQVSPVGYATAKLTNSDPNSVARHSYSVPFGTSLRVEADIFREAVDWVGGGLTIYTYCPSTAIGTWDFLDCLRIGVKRDSGTGIAMGAEWHKPSGGAPPFEVVVLQTLLHGANQGFRYIWEIDEPNLKVRLFRADFLTGNNEVFVAEGDLPPDLVAHVAGERRVGWANRRAGTGIVGFRLYELTFYELLVEAPLSGAPCSLLLQVFEDDGVTVRWEVSTDPAHANPYLGTVDNYSEQSLDLAGGTASLTSVSWAIGDHPLVAGDQDGGLVTGQLASLGVPDLGGRRCRLLRFLEDGSTFYVIADGPAGQPRLNADYASYSGEIRDTRETERKIRCFDTIGVLASDQSGASDPVPTVAGSGFGFTWGTKYH